uniref:SMI1/KNR4 family protein n=1 Tax=Streptomyces sp. NBC_01393 TaxID=2903851 RepID=A0AAU3IB29_9ACTN
MKSLAAAGLLLVDGWSEPEGLVPAIVTGQAPSCPPEEGHVEAMLDVLDPLLHEKANADWYRLSVEAGLFSETDRRFLLALAPEEYGRPRWYCVELQREWDIMGEGAAGPLGSTFCRPEFRMLSLDGAVLCFATTWEHDISTSVLRAPHRSRVLRRWAEALTDGTMDHPDEPPLSAAARCWLDSTRELSD